MMHTTETLRLMSQRSFLWNRRTWLGTKNALGPLLAGSCGATTAGGNHATGVRLAASFGTLAESAACATRASPAFPPSGRTLGKEGALPAREARVPEAGCSAHTICGCSAVNSGKQFILEFADQSRYQLHTAWLKDASPSNVGADFYRRSAADVSKLDDFRIARIEPGEGGERLVVHYESTGAAAPAGPAMESFEAKWLHAFAPYVGKALGAGAAGAGAAIRGTGSLFDALQRRRTPWLGDLEIPAFRAGDLARDADLQVEFIEAMVDPGVAMITDVDPPASLEREAVGKPMEDLVMEVIGKMNQHPVRSTRYGVMRKTAESAKQGADYDMANPLSMHTDHSVYHGTPGFLQFLYQAQGSVTSKVCDGLAVAEYVREHHPASFELLSTVEITHSSRNNLYTREGAPRDVRDASTEGMPFELVHTHPVIQLDAEGHVEKVVQSETKRGVCALPYSVYEPFMEAYALWVELCEDPRFIRHFEWPEGSIVVTNNWRTMHGRASIPPGMARTMVFAYVGKVLVENRYRLLRQNQVERETPSLDYTWLTRVPNQVLEKMLAP